MSRTSFCRLCINSCQDYKPLFDENGRLNEVYEVTSQYFDPLFLKVEEGSHSTVLCLKCWHHISDFHSFKQSVVQAQEKLLAEEFQQFEITIKSEELIEMEGYNQDALVEVPIKQEHVIQLTDSSPRNDDDDDEFLSEDCTKPDELNDIADISSSDVEQQELQYITSDDGERRLWEHQAEITNKSKLLPAADRNAHTQEGSEHNYCEKRTEPKPTETEKLKELDDFIAQHFPNLECVICSEYCSSFSELQQHFRRQHPKEKCHILCCQRKLGSRFQVEEHLHLHNDPNAFQCTICHIPFSGRYSLYSHVYAEHRNPNNQELERKGNSGAKEKGNTHNQKRKSMEIDAIIAQWKPNLECLVCRASFPNFGLLRQHFRQEHPRDECNIFCCGRKFNDRSKIGEHARFHLDPNAFKCELCDAKHSCKRNLYFHIRTYHPQSRDGIAPDSVEIRKPARKKRCITITSREIDNSIAQYKPDLECDVCKETCSNFTLLKTHFRIQHPTKPFYILCCERKFNNRSEYENHLRLHIDPHAFKCDQCGKCLSSVKKLRAHKKRIHFEFEGERAEEIVNVDSD